MNRARWAPAFAGLVAAAGALSSCFESGIRWESPPESDAGTACTKGQLRCSTNVLERCDDGPIGPAFLALEDCAEQGLVCAGALLACAVCAPGQGSCDGQEASTCVEDGSRFEAVETCDPSVGEACRGGSCPDLCYLASVQKSNVGCEYWAVDLDNARISSTSNAAAQQFAVVVSNPQPDVPAFVRIFQDDGNPGDEPSPREIANATIAPLNLEVFRLGPREVDGSAEGTFDSGSHTALTRHAYRVEADFPVVAYQFNPLENANVFSNDASLLKPREALPNGGGTLTPAYVVAGWPQTIAITDDPDTNFSSLTPLNLRAFVTIVGTREATTIRVRPTTAVRQGGPVKRTGPGDLIEVTLGAFDVLNLETPDQNAFGADFTGTVIEANGPIAVFSGAEATDAPHFEKLSERRCCADHIEDQLDPLRAMGKKFAIAHTPNRSAAVKAAGGGIESAVEPDFIRFVAASTKGTLIRTSLPAPDDEIELGGLGDFHEVTVFGDFVAESEEPVSVIQVMASQDASGIPRGLPGGDPSLIVVPPVEQFRPDYVFLTPDKYAFDFISIVAPPEASLLLDGEPLDGTRCLVGPTDGLTAEERGSEEPPFLTYLCQLSFPIVDPKKVAPGNVSPGMQNDGVHRLTASRPVGVAVVGWDNYVSYAYAGGTELRDIAAPL